jgi:hypothetical protein
MSHPAGSFRGRNRSFRGREIDTRATLMSRESHHRNFPLAVYELQASFRTEMRHLVM